MVLLLGKNHSLNSAAPTVAPTRPQVDPLSPEQPKEGGEIPDVWEMPTQGVEWCDCGENHQLTPDHVRAVIRATLGSMPEESITHVQVCAVIMELWRYISVCQFFHDQVNLSAKAMYGSVAKEYPIKIGMEIIAHFSKHWHGCPQEACEGGFGPDLPNN